MDVDFILTLAVTTYPKLSLAGRQYSMEGTVNEHAMGGSIGRRMWETGKKGGKRDKPVYTPAAAST